ncbi:MAG: serine/threonine-protein kinase [Labilithrix sp.]
MLEIVAEPLTPGTLLADIYRLERVLGQGGMGVVWAARDEKTGRDVALKVLADDRATDPTQQARILREASAAMTIDHPNVVKVSAVLETEAGVPFIVMERLDGEPLRALLLRRGTLDAATCLPILLGVIEAIAAAHAAGIVHRDLKPENVFLLPGGGVKVLDFGIAKRIARGDLESATAEASLTSTGAVIGTPYYMAPEQVFGDEDVDARADVWSLGVILYECLAGVRPTEAEGFGPILKKITSARFDALPESVPPRLASIVMRMLSRDRAARPSLDEVRTTLSNLDEPSPASLARTAETTATRRRSTLAIAVIVVAAGAGAVAMKSRVHAAVVEPSLEAGSDSLGSPGSNEGQLFLAASSFQAKRDGKSCLDRLDQHDRLPTRSLPKTTDITGGYSGVRATCMMLVGDCEEGRKLYRAWLPLHTPLAQDDAFYDSATDMVMKQFCQPKP